jgi:dTDP-4-dehydrorhamnose reductase
MTMLHQVVPSMSKRIAVFGSNGQIGSHMIDLLQAGSHYMYFGFNSTNVDYSNPQEVHRCIDMFEPDVIVNCVAYTNVAGAEEKENQRLASLLNIQLPKNLTDAARRHNAQLIHFSTDYVYDGKKNEYFETDKLKPLNNYGLTKSVGDKFVLEYERAKVFRVQSVYSNRNSNFYKAIVGKAEKGEPVSVVDDQYTCPTSADWIAKQVHRTLLIPSYGLFHLSPNKFCSFADFAERIIGGRVPLKRIRYKELDSPVQRPLVTILNHEKFNHAFFPITDSWEDVYEDFLIN